jgi:competence protein ComFC
MLSGRTLIRTFTAPLLDVLFPPACLSCKTLLSAQEKYVCSSCWATLERITSDHPLYGETRNKLLAEGAVSELYSCYLFHTEGVFQQLAHAMKYEGFVSIGLLFGREIGAALNEKQERADALIPIPLHKRKIRERGYNQAELIARGISDVTAIPVRTDLVRRTRYTQTQTKLHRDERKKNMEKAFEVPSELRAFAQDKRCILVDDVITTGATIHSCASELLQAGAASVIAVSAALAE